ncbi:MAG: site-specific DNA-methyltransferase, partial [Clostridiaceae bacterium]|nr:site-specific DNA-methyltransferase [Clostridiaceae bacterium]
MDKLKMETQDMAELNIEKIETMFPNVITEAVDGEGKPRKAINFELLKQMLFSDVLEGDEAYEFTWVGKKASIVEANKPIRKTLRPCKEESKDWDTTENLYIEGDNLDVLKLLQESYLGKVKMIYIDPPYNTGSDFVYRDNFSMAKDEYDEASGVFDEDENRLFLNNPSNGRFHSDWCSMIYPRLLLSRNLLSRDGVILISIDDNEVENMKAICNEVFGANQFVAQLVWEKKKKGSFLSNSITNIKEYVLVYCKEANDFEGLIGEINSEVETYPCVNAPNKREKRVIPAGIVSKYKEKNYTLTKGSEISDTTMSIVLLSDLVIKNGVLAEELTIEGNWRYSQEAMTEYALKNELYITRDLYLRRIVSDTRYKTLKDILPRIGDDSDVSH